ncbi:histone-lysine N-methyltransferase, H3 lysine-36 specific-like [Battus philenor]|uniref:histone-lysine N-methyltransferase, H3 lysine-36 specific-like n=1 Tax=Battus philenor TaxID=42288 RepID=UPI0035CFB598
MDESEDNLSAEEIKYIDSPTSVRIKSKKRSLVERELETSLTARVTSPITNGENCSTSRYGRARRLKTELDSSDSEKSVTKSLKSPKFDKSPVQIQSPVYKMHASNSPLRMETPKRSTENLLETQIENIYNENISLSRFGSEEKRSASPAKKFPKVYIRTDLIQSKEKETTETITLIKNMFSPIKVNKPSSTHLGNVLERSSEKYSLDKNQKNGYLDTSSVVKTLDFDGSKKKKRENREGKSSLSKSDIFEMEAKCEYQVGDLAWARMGTYPFWPCIITRDPLSGTFVKKKLFGRIERDVLHVTFFGDNGRRGWIVDNMLRKFSGQLEFETTREQFSSEAKKRDPRLYASFFISEKKLPQWIVSVEEAESLMREPKRLRIDILRDMLEKTRDLKTTPKLESKKVTRTNSDVSLSESLYDSLFSEDDSKNNDTERSKSKTRNKSLDVSEVVTACLDNMAAKTGITKIQRQSHMDRWLQKAKSKTPEKSFLKSQPVSKTDKESKQSNTKHKRSTSKETRSKKSLSLKRNRNESQDEIESKLLSHQNEHDYSKQEYHKINDVRAEDKDHVKIEDFNENLGIEAMSFDVDMIPKSVLNKIQGTNGANEVPDILLTVENEESVVTKVENNQGNSLVQTSSKLNTHEQMHVDLYDTGVQDDNLAIVSIDTLPSLEDKYIFKEAVQGENEVLDISEQIDKTVDNQLTDDASMDSVKCDKEIDATNSEMSDFEDVSMDEEKDKDTPSYPTSSNMENACEPDTECNNGEENNLVKKNDLGQEYFNTNTLHSKEITVLSLNEQAKPNKLHELEIINENEPFHDSENSMSETEDAVKHNLVFEYDNEINNYLESDVASKFVKNKNIDIIAHHDSEESCSNNTQFESLDRDVENNTDDDQNQEENCIDYCNQDQEIISFPNRNIQLFSSKHKSDEEVSGSFSNNETAKNIVNMKINPVPIEESLSNCEMVCLPNFKKDYNSVDSNNDKVCVNVKSSELNVNKSLKRDISNNIEVNNFLDRNLKKEDIELDCINEKLLKNEKVAKSDKSDFHDTFQLNRSIKNVLGFDTNEHIEEIVSKGENNEQNEDRSIEETEKQSNRTSDLEEMESVDSDYTEELSSNDPNSEFDPANDAKVKEKSNSKSSDGYTDGVSLSSEISEMSENKRTERTKFEKHFEKKSNKCPKKDLNDPEFLKYMELRQDALIDENPHLSQEEITSYLYNTWLYEESTKSDKKKNDDIDHATLVKGLDQPPVPPKRVRKKAKVDVVVRESYENEEIIPKSKSKRKIIRPYYNEDYSDIDSEYECYDMYENRSNHKTNDSNQDGQANENHNEEEMLIDDYDQVEEYFDQLTRPKPNLFKGLIREKVCEVCEKTGNLVKCKGCHSMFHVDCTKKETAVIEAQTPTRGRKKKKRNRGRKQKLSVDSNGVDNGSQSDEKSQDLNASEENISIEDIESESHIIVDADNIEVQLSAKMKEMFDEFQNEYFSDSSENELDWSDTEAGKCKIVDIKLPSKNRNSDNTDFKCNKCLEYDTPVCFVCKSPTSPRDGVEYRQRCQVAHCYRYFHLECLDHWPQTQFNSGEISRNNKKIKGFFEPMTCPRHVCHTCVSDDPRGCKTRFSGDKLARCIRCPATYHSFTKCLPAGTQVLTGSQIICPRHYKHRPGKVPCHVNTGWCFICALGGSLICCEYCPTSFHAECLNIKPPEGGYMCEDCETGRLPLYGEMVWVKLGHYRWWPGIILHPSEIPTNILAVKHSLGEFVVRFFGQYDHYWVNRGRVFPFQEGDSGKVSSQKSKIDAAFSMAMDHAKRACEILKNVTPNEEESLDIASSLLPPHYVKLKVNKPCGSLCGKRLDLEESSLTQCECNPDEEDPCGPYSQCLNRMLLTECGPTCRAGDRCNNRAFEKRLYPKLVPYRTPHRGWGLKTLEDIKAGQFVIEYVGELIDEEEFKRRMLRKYEIRDENYYFLTLDKERMIDAGPKGNLARFMNHCCEPNCETQKWTVLGDVRVGLFAKRDIPANSEVTFNYNLQCAGIEKKRCLCGAKRCSGYIGAKPKQTGPQPKKNRKEVPTKRTYKKRKNVEISPTIRNKTVKRRASRSKPRELTEIEKDLLIIKNATNGMSSDSECSGRLSVDSGKEARAQKRRRVGFSTEEIIIYNGPNSPSTKKIKMDKIEDGD